MLEIDKIQEQEKFWVDYDNLSNEDKIDKLKHFLFLYKLDCIDMCVKNMQLKDEIRERDKKIKALEEVIDSHFGKWKLFRL